MVPGTGVAALWPRDPSAAAEGADLGSSSCRSWQEAKPAQAVEAFASPDAAAMAISAAWERAAAREEALSIR